MLGVGMGHLVTHREVRPFYRQEQRDQRGQSRPVAHLLLVHRPCPAAPEESVL